MIARMGEIVGGHRIDEAVMLSKMRPAIKTVRDGKPIAGDIGRLMPLAEAFFPEDLQCWIDHLRSINTPFCVVRCGRKIRLYKERKACVGSADLGVRN